MNKSLVSLCLLTICIYSLAVPVSRGVGNENPTGPTGEYNGSVTTAGSYDPLTGNAKRTIDDLTVTGSVGAYPLEWKRTLNTRSSFNAVGFGSAGAWTHNYHWSLWLRFHHEYHYYPDLYEGPDGVVTFPDGRTMELEVLEDNTFWQKHGSEHQGRIVHVGNGNYDLILPDGGRVKFVKLTAGTGGSNLRAEAIVDPSGQTTRLTYDTSGHLTRVTEPAGRYLQINYGSAYVYNGQTYNGGASGVSRPSPVKVSSWRPSDTRTPHNPCRMTRGYGCWR